MTYAIFFLRPTNMNSIPKSELEMADPDIVATVVNEEKKSFQMIESYLKHEETENVPHAAKS